MVRYFNVFCLLIVIGCVNGNADDSKLGKTNSSSVENVNEDISAHFVSIPFELGYPDVWTYQFGNSVASWPAPSAGDSHPNMECGPASVSIIEKMTGRVGAGCNYVAEGFEGCPNVHSACRRAGLRCGGLSVDGFTPRSSIGNSISNLKFALEALGYRVTVYAKGTNRELALDAVKNAILANHPLIVEVDACQYAIPEWGKKRTECSDSHLIVIYGYSDNYVYILDPGYNKGKATRVTTEHFNLAIAGYRSGLEITRPGFEEFPNATWYPPGTLLRSEGEYYYVGEDFFGPITFHASLQALQSQRIPTERAIDISPNVLSCFEAVAELDPTLRYREYREEDTGTIYLVDTALRRRYAFLSWASYLSWNGDDDEWRNATQDEVLIWSNWPRGNDLGFASGILVGTTDRDTAIYVVVKTASGTERRWIVDEQTAKVFGYQIAHIGADERVSTRVNFRDIDTLTGARGADLFEALCRECGTSRCLDGTSCFGEAAGGGEYGEEAVASERESLVELEDSDGDGYSPPDDCDDLAFWRYPGAIEECADEVDDDCDGAIDEGCSRRPEDPKEEDNPDSDNNDDNVPEIDWDGDGVSDRNDNCPTAVNASQDDVDRDGQGDRCDCDNDNDGYQRTGECGGTDCADRNTAVHPWVDELCNGRDDDCDGTVDEGVLNVCDFCGIVPVEVCGDRIDNNCDGEVDEGCGGGEEPLPLPHAPPDSDSDGDADADADTDTDADVDADVDTDSDVDVDVALDDDGDGVIDSWDDCPDVPDSEQRDMDNDGFDLCDCDADGDGYFSYACWGGEDCQDRNSNVYPGAPDSCVDGWDWDCDGLDC